MNITVRTTDSVSHSVSDNEYYGTYYRYESDLLKRVTVLISWAAPPTFPFLLSLARSRACALSRPLAYPAFPSYMSPMHADVRAGFYLCDTNAC